MHGIRRSLALLLVLSLALSALVGCSGATKAPAIDETPAELTLLVWPTISREAIDDAIFEYNKKRPNVRIRVREFERARVVGGNNQQAAALLEGVDIAILPRSQAVQLATAGLLRDLSAIRLPQLNDGVAHLFDDLSKLDGRRFGLPMEFTPTMMTVNQQVFTNNGLKLPSTDWTLQEFEQVLQSLKAAGQTVQITPAALIAPLVGAFGGQAYDPHTQRWLLETDEAKQALAYLARLTQEGLIPAESTGGAGVVFALPGGGGGGGGNNPGGGRGGFAGGGPALIALPSGFNLRGLIGGAGGALGNIAAQQPYPKGPKGRSVSATATLTVVSSASAHGEVAIDFARYLSTDESAQMALAKGGVRPVIASSKALAAWQDAVGDRSAQMIEISLQGAHADLGANYNQVARELVPYFQGKVTLDQILPDLMAKLN